MSEARLQFLERWVERLRTRPRIHLTPWTTWTPTITQSGSVTFTNSYCRYMVVERLVITQAQLTVTGSGTAGNTIIIGGIPSAIQPGNSNYVVGVGMILDQGVANYPAVVQLLSASTFRFMSTSNNAVLGVSPSFALANTDAIFFSTQWELP